MEVTTQVAMGPLSLAGITIMYLEVGGSWNSATQLTSVVVELTRFSVVADGGYDRFDGRVSAIAKGNENEVQSMNTLVAGGNGISD